LSGCDLLLAYLLRLIVIFEYLLVETSFCSRISQIVTLVLVPADLSTVVSGSRLSPTLARLLLGF